MTGGSRSSHSVLEYLRYLFPLRSLWHQLLPWKHTLTSNALDYSYSLCLDSLFLLANSYHGLVKSTFCHTNQNTIQRKNLNSAAKRWVSWWYLLPPPDNLRFLSDKPLDIAPMKLSQDDRNS